jgi:hypothetical protein
MRHARECGLLINRHVGMRGAQFGSGQECRWLVTWGCANEGPAGVARTCFVGPWLSEKHGAARLQSW